MPDYKAKYRKLLRATEQAANLLIAAQMECEEHGVLSLEPEEFAAASPTREEDKRSTEGK